MRDLACLLFLHIPKTAGTSFRNGAVKRLGASHCQFDYGLKSPDTTALVREHVYQTPDLFRLRAELEKTGSRLLAGHFGLNLYGPLFRSGKMLAFCRDPREQLLSHFAHATRLNGYSGTLTEFLASPAGGGCQSRVFGQVPPQAIGFIGVTERYEESLRVIRETLGLEVKPMVHNANPERNGTGKYSVPEEAASALAAAVAKDMPVYCTANRLLDQRIAALDAGYPYVHGMIQSVNPSAVRGFAFNGSDDRPVVVELVVNDKSVASCQASFDRPGLRVAGVSRHGYVGFAFHGQNLLQAGDRAVVRVAASGQVLGEHVLKAPKAQESS